MAFHVVKNQWQTIGLGDHPQGLADHGLLLPSDGPVEGGWIRRDHFTPTIPWRPARRAEPRASSPGKPGEVPGSGADPAAKTVRPFHFREAPPRGQERFLCDLLRLDAAAGDGEGNRKHDRLVTL